MPKHEIIFIFLIEKLKLRKAIFLKIRHLPKKKKLNDFLNVLMTDEKMTIFLSSFL